MGNVSVVKDKNGIEGVKWGGFDLFVELLVGMFVYGFG